MDVAASYKLRRVHKSGICHSCVARVIAGSAIRQNVLYLTMSSEHEPAADNNVQGNGTGATGENHDRRQECWAVLVERVG